MNQISPQTYTKWQDDLICCLKDSAYEQSLFSPVFEFLSDIKASNSIRAPFSEFKDDFINSFIPNIISIVLRTHSPSASIDSNYAKLLKAFSSLVPYLIGSNYDNFVEAASSIVTNQKASFYSQSFSDFFGTSSSFSPHYQTCIKAISSPNFLQQMNLYFEQNNPPSLHRTYLIFVFLLAIHKSLDQKALKESLKNVLKIIKRMQKHFDDKDFRNLNEKEMNRIYKNFLVISSDSQFNSQMMEIYVNFNIKLIKSGLLSKQYSGLKVIKEVITSNNKSISHLGFTSLEKDKVIDYLLQNTHHELVKEFVVIMREMIKANMILPEQIKQFWKMSVRQHQSTIETFFSALISLAVTLTSQQKSALFDAIIETNEYPDSALSFLGKKILKFDQKQIKTLFTKLSELYFSGSRKESNQLILSALSKLVPTNKEDRMQIQNKCLHYIENQEHLQYSLAILKEILVNLPEESARSYFYSIINLPSITNPQYLDLILRICHDIQGPLTEEEFTKLNSTTKDLIHRYLLKFISFWKEMIAKKRLSSDMILVVFKEACEVQFISNDLFSFLKFLFAKMNVKRMLYDSGDTLIGIKKIRKCKGLGDLWKLLYRVGSRQIIEFVIFLYQKSRDKDRFPNFIKFCSSNLNNSGVLTALSLLIHEVEDGIYKDLLNIEQNKFLSDEYYYTINVVGDCNMNMKVPRDISLNSLFSQISYILDKSRQCLVFTVNDQVFSKNDKLENNMTINVQINRKNISYAPPLPNPSALPSIILYNSPICNQLYQIMISNDPEKSILAYEVLSLMPNIKEEEKLIWQAKKEDWDSILQTEKPVLFLYRTNIIGHFIVSNDSKWYDRFVTSGAALKYINTVLNLPSKISIPSLTRLIRVCIVITKQNHWTTFMHSLFKETADESDSIINIINVIIQHNDTELTSACLFFISKIAFWRSEILAKHKNLQQLVKRTIFDKSIEIRESIRNIILMLPLDIQNGITTPLLSLSETTPRCEQFFTIIKEIAKETKNVKELWEKLVNIFYDRFAFPKSENPLDKLEFETPYPNFVNGIITTLIELIKRPETSNSEFNLSLESASELFWFIVDNILLNGFKYYELTNDYFVLLSLLVQKYPSISTEFIKKLSEIDFPSSKFILKCKLSPYKREKGLRNLGATCYMNSTLQQVYHIEDFRNLILSSHIESSDINSKWLFELQKIFAQLLYFPSSYIDPSGFVSVWKGWDDSYINPREQHDAMEFLQMLLYRIEEKIPNSTNIFKGEIVHSVVGISQEYSAETVETFLSFPLEVKDNPRIEDSLTTFLAPDRFEGQNQYSVEGIGKIDAERFSRVRKAPKILIIQLKRFEYNLKTGLREKINDKYTFNYELDLSSVMENPCEYAKYQLTGVTIHMGNAKGGHYISHILTEYGWLTFNDENAGAISEERLFGSSYGGYDYVDTWDENGKKMTTLKVPKGGNAYLLFYKRVMISTRDESSYFDFSKVPTEMRSIDPPALVSLLNDMRGVLLKNVLLNPNFNNFLIRSIKSSDEDLIFLYNYFLICIRNRADQNHLIQLSNICKNGAKSPGFADQVFSNEKHLLEFLLLESSKKMRKLYLSLLEVLSPYVSLSVKEKISNFILNKILNEGDKLMEKWKNFDEFFKPLTFSFGCNTETWAPILFDFLLTNVLEYAQNILNMSTSSKSSGIHHSKKKDQGKNKERKSKDSDNNILTQIDLSAIFETLNYVIKKHDLYNNYRAQAMDSNFLLSFVLSKKHSHPFIKFAVSFNVKPESLFKKYSNNLNATGTASFFLIAYFYNNDTSFVTKFVASKDQGFIEDFFRGLTDRVLSLELGGKNNLLIPMKDLLENFVMSRKKSLRVSILEFLEAAQVNKKDLFNFLMSELDNIIDIVDLISYDITKDNLPQDIAQDMLPTKEYFDLLKKTVLLGGFQKEIIRQGKSFTSALKKFSRMSFFPNFPIISALDFLSESIGEENSEEFFINASFSAFLESMTLKTTFNQYEFIKNLLCFIPLSKSEALFKHPLLSEIIELSFRDKYIGQLLMEQILKRTTAQNCKTVASVLFRTDAYQKNVSHNGEFYFITCWKLVKKYPEMASKTPTDVVDGCLDCVEKFLAGANSASSGNNGGSIKNLSTIAPFTAKFLSVQCRSFAIINKGKKSFFKGDLVQNLSKKFYHLNLKQLLISARHESKFFDLLRTVVSLTDKASQRVFELIENEKDGLLKKVSTSSLKSGSKLVALVCKLNNDNPKARPIIIRELAFTITSESVEPFCDLLFQQKSLKFSSMIPTVQKIISETNDPKIFSKNFGRLMIEAARSDPSVVNLWVEKATLFLQQIIADQNIFERKKDIVVIIEFLMQIVRSYNPQMPKLLINQNEIQQLKSIEVATGDNVAEALSSLQMIKEFV